MKRSHLLQIAAHLARYRKISIIEKVDDTIIKIAFEKDEPYFFDMRRGDSYIFQKAHYKKPRNYNSPFDVVLTKRFKNATIQKIEVLEGNRILRIYAASNSSYKAESSILQFEFTGRNTNIIILDEHLEIQEAFRHIDASTSFREVKVGLILAPLPPREFVENSEPISDITAYLHHEGEKRESQSLTSAKIQKALMIEKKLQRLKESFDALEKEETLMAQSRALLMDGNLVLSYLHTMNNYQKEITVSDYEGNPRTITLPSDTRTPAEAANSFFTRSKKLKQKAKNSHIERENLEAKILFLERLKESVMNAQTMDEINLYLPKQPKMQKNRVMRENNNIETFFIEGYKLSLGKNEKGNIALLKEAKMSDIWMHLKDIPSTHVIIRNDKKSPPQAVLEFGAKLCVQFSGVLQGDYLVDFTPRRNVKMREGAHVNYVEYQTLKVTKT